MMRNSRSSSMPSFAASSPSSQTQLLQSASSSPLHPTHTFDFSRTVKAAIQHLPSSRAVSTAQAWHTDHLCTSPQRRQSHQVMLSTPLRFMSQPTCPGAPKRQRPGGPYQTAVLDSPMSHHDSTAAVAQPSVEVRTYNWQCRQRITEDSAAAAVLQLMATSRPVTSPEELFVRLQQGSVKA